MDSREYKNIGSGAGFSGEHSDDEVAQSNVVNLQNKGYWREEVSHDSFSEIAEMSELEHLTLIKFKASELGLNYTSDGICAIAAACARICRHARAAGHDTIACLARDAGLAAMDQNIPKLKRTIIVLNEHVDVQFRGLVIKAWSRGFDDFGSSNWAGYRNSEY